MSNYNSLKTTIDANIKQNGRQEITGQILNSVLNQMVNTLGAGYQFAGVATTATTPGSPDAKVFYIANGKGTYTNFGGIDVTEDDVVVLYWDSSWHKVSTGIASQVGLAALILEVYGRHFEQATQVYLGAYTEDGTYTSYSVRGYIFVDVKSFRGQSITCNNSLVIQYAFFKNFTPGQNTILADGTSRVTGRPVSVTIPQDADVLYLYIGTNITSPIPVVSVTGEVNGITDDLQTLENEVQSAEDIASSAISLVNEQVIPTYKVTEERNTEGVSPTNFVIGADGVPSANNNYRLVTIDVDSPFDLWFNAADKSPFPSFLAISTIHNGIYTPRKRYVSGTEDALPTQENPLHLVAGDTLLINSYITQFQGKYTYHADVDKKTYNGQIPLAEQHVQQVVDAIMDGEQMYAEKNATTLKVYCKLPNGKYVGYPLTYRQKSYAAGQYPSFYDNWGVMEVGVYEKTENGMQLLSEIFQNGEAEMAIRATSGASSDFVFAGGAAHGFENIMSDTNGRCISFLVDNQKVGETDVFSLRSIGRVEVLQKTQVCQAYTNSNPFAEALKNWIWDNDGFRIKTSVKITRSVAINQAHLGMFCVYRRWNGDTSQPYLTNRAIKNNLPFEVFNVEDGWSITRLMNADNGCTKIIEYGEMGYGFSMEIKDANTRSNGGMFVHTNGTGKYNKIYYTNCNYFNPNVGDELNATQVWSIEG